MTNWMTLRFVLTSRGGEPLSHPPGRVVLAHADHTFADVADCVDPAFGRWDLSPDHRFTLPDRVVSSADEFEDVDASDELTLTEGGLRLGSTFTYEFDPDERWQHAGEVTDHDIDPLDLYDDEPDDPVCIDGWGVLPDQYGRHREDDDVEEPSPDDDAERASSWEVVDRALADRPAEPEHAQLTRVVTTLRADPDGWPQHLLWKIAEVSPDAAPDDAVAAWLTLAAAMVDPAELDEATDADEITSLASLEPADWAGAVIELVRDGVGASAEPGELTTRVLYCPEIEGDEPSQEDAEVVERGLAAAVPLWRALGAVDEEHRLTILGAWGLPEALRTAWVVEDREAAHHGAPF